VRQWTRIPPHIGAFVAPRPADTEAKTEPGAAAGATAAPPAKLEMLPNPARTHDPAARPARLHAQSRKLCRVPCSGQTRVKRLASASAAQRVERGRAASRRVLEAGSIDPC
jgi:hypothetical protein